LNNDDLQPVEDCELEEAGNFVVVHDKLLGRSIVINRDGAELIKLIKTYGIDRATELIGNERDDNPLTIVPKARVFLKEIRDSTSLSNKINIRNLTEEDIKLFSNSDECSFDVSDLKMTYSVFPNNFFVAEFNRIPVGMIGCPIYRPVGRIGWLFVRREARHRGVGTSLAKYALNFLNAENVSLIMLNASSSGFPIFKKLGFIETGHIIFMTKETESATGYVAKNEIHPNEATASLIEEICAYDKISTGLNRKHILETLLQNPGNELFIKRNERGELGGYLICQKDAIGPWVCEPAIAHELLTSALSRHKRTRIIVPGSNRHVKTLLQNFGFTEISQCVVMYKGNYNLTNLSTTNSLLSSANG